MATEVPRFPFTITITNSPKIGSSVMAIKKFLLYLDVCL